MQSDLDVDHRVVPGMRGGPNTYTTEAAFSGSSPRRRGWSDAHFRQGGRLRVVPAHAGVVP